MDVKRKKKRDRNNFINLVLNNIILAKGFSKQCKMTITEKRIFTHVKIKFYLRRRFTSLYLYIRLLGNFENKKSYGELIRDFKRLVSILEIESTTGNYYGFTVEIKPETETELIKFLKLLSLFAHPEDFYIKVGKRDYSYYNYITSSDIPIHINISQNLIDSLESEDLQNFFKSIRPRKVGQK